jgi:hypothetical protein
VCRRCGTDAWDRYPVRHHESGSRETVNDSFPNGSQKFNWSCGFCRLFRLVSPGEKVHRTTGGAGQRCHWLPDRFFSPVIPDCPTARLPGRSANPCGIYRDRKNHGLRQSVPHTLGANRSEGKAHHDGPSLA